ncbi:MAG: hypothetical protein JW827_02420 [Spirochaetes bacterium]|nr:hypothetical protein [Spirochaetota bacterium]
MKKILAYILIITFTLSITPLKPLNGSLKQWALPIMGVGILAGVGAALIRKKALEKYDEAELVWQEYMAIPSGKANEVFETAYEKYQDKYGAAVQYRNYYLIVGGIGLLAVAAGAFLLIWSPKENVSVGYNPNFYSMNNDVYLQVKF